MALILIFWLVPLYFKLMTIEDVFAYMFAHRFFILFSILGIALGRTLMCYFNIGSYIRAYVGVLFEKQK